jgi:hypothetical protein
MAKNESRLAPQTAARNETPKSLSTIRDGRIVNAMVLVSTFAIAAPWG